MQIPLSESRVQPSIRTTCLSSSLNFKLPFQRYGNSTLHLGHLTLFQTAYFSLSDGDMPSRRLPISSITSESVTDCSINSLIRITQASRITTSLFSVAYKCMCEPDIPDSHE